MFSFPKDQSVLLTPCTQLGENHQQIPLCIFISHCTEMKEIKPHLYCYTIESSGEIWTRISLSCEKTGISVNLLAGVFDHSRKARKQQRTE
jgi:hypothetical protein